MPPKKNAFFAFVFDYKNQEKSKGKQTPSFQELADQLSDTWNLMSIEEKDKYKILAKNLNAKKKTKNNKVDIPHIINIRNSTSDYWTMKHDLEKIFTNINTNEELLNHKFILVHINCHSHVEEQYYFPAEIAALEFCLKDGVTRRHHQFIGISNICPRGYAGSMRQYSETFHQINCWEEHWDDYENILLELINFFKNESDDNIDLHNSTLDLPYIFTIEREDGIDMMKMKNSLEKLYITALPDSSSEQVKSVFKIGSVEELFIQIIQKLKIHLDPRSLNSSLSAHDILEADMYGRGLGCVYHHLRDIEYKCSRARILKWLSNICKYVSEYRDLEIKPGKHVAALLRDGSRRIFDTRNEHVPITAYDLIIDKINSSKDFQKMLESEPLETSKSMDESVNYLEDDDTIFSDD